MTSPSSGIKFALEKGRYRLYAAMSCPFAHRVRLVRLVQGLEDALDVTFVTAQSVQDGFNFAGVPEPEFQALSLKEVYHKANPDYSGTKYTVPLIVDKSTKKMVDNTESLDLAMALAAQSGDSHDLVPEGAEALARELDDKVSSAVYYYLFGGDASAKQKVAEDLFKQLDHYEELLGKQEYLMGSQLSFPDLVLWATLIRYDNVYARQFGIEGKVLKKDYPNLTRYTEKIFNMPSKKGDVTLGEDANIPEIIRMYWQSAVLAPKAGNDPEAPVPEPLPVF